jgi:hypothetical protein
MFVALARVKIHIGIGGNGEKKSNLGNMQCFGAVNMCV